MTDTLEVCYLIPKDELMELISSRFKSNIRNQLEKIEFTKGDSITITYQLNIDCVGDEE